MRVIERGNGPRLLLEAQQSFSATALCFEHKLECYVTPDAKIFGFVDPAHPARSDVTQNPIMSDRFTDHRILRLHRFCKGGIAGGCASQRGLFQEGPELVVGTQEGTDFTFEGTIIGAGLTQERILLIGGQVQRRLQQIVDSFPAGIIH
jgi:hypothetical protein